MREECFVTEETAGDRIDKFLAEQYEDLSRSFLQKLLKSGEVMVNGRPVKASYKAAEGDTISFEVPEAVEPEIVPEDIPLDILYEDHDVILVNKPKGMVVHPAAGHYTGTLVNALMYHCKEDLSGINGVLRPGIVHRIDMDTTGVIIACKNDLAHNSIAAQLKEHSITRRYQAIVSNCARKILWLIGISIYAEFVYPREYVSITREYKKLLVGFSSWVSNSSLQRPLSFAARFRSSLS